MPLTAAEKMKRYRERLKLNPEKFEEQRKKNLDRIKSKYKYKKVSDMSDEEKTRKRIEWRDEKRRLKDKKKANEQISNAASTSKSSTSKSSRINYKQKYMAALNRIIYLQRVLETMRKRLYRSQQYQMQVKKKCEVEFNKLKARNEILEASLKSTYKQCVTNKERDVIKKSLLMIL